MMHIAPGDTLAIGEAVYSATESVSVNDGQLITHEWLDSAGFVRVRSAALPRPNRWHRFRAWLAERIRP